MSAEPLIQPNPLALLSSSVSGTSPPETFTTDETSTAKPGTTTVLPIMPLRGVVLFPGAVVPLSVGRAASLRLLEESLPQSKQLGLVLQKNSEEENPSVDGLHAHGVVGRVIRMMRQNENSVVILVQGESRMRLGKVTQDEPYMKAEVEVIASVSPSKDDEYWQAAVRNLRESAEKLLQLRTDVPDEFKLLIGSLEDASALTDFLAGNLSIDAAEKQKLLEETNVVRRVTSLQTLLNSQLHIAQLQSKLREDVQSEFSEAQKRAYLREQLRAIQKELGEEGSQEEQVEDLRTRLDKAGLPEKAQAQVKRELKRLEIIPQASPDHSVIVSYLEDARGRIAVECAQRGNMWISPKRRRFSIGTTMV